MDREWRFDGALAFETGVQLKNSVQSGLPILAVDIILRALWILDHRRRGVEDLCSTHFQPRIPHMPSRSARQLPNDAQKAVDS